MKKEEYLNVVTKQIHYIFDRKHIEAELKEHVEDSIEELMEEGLPYVEAETQAVLQMGDPVETGKLLNKEHHPVIGYIYAASNVLLIVMGIYFTFMILAPICGLIESANPVIAENSIEIYPINKEINIPTNRILIDNICLHEDGRYILTYRSWRKLSYSRAGWSVQGVAILNSDGERIHAGSTASGTMLTELNRIDFDWPEDGILILQFVDGQTCRLNLKEYLHE